MPTQVPSGSALAVKNPQRRRRRAARGPKLLRYAQGGKVLVTKETGFAPAELHRMDKTTGFKPKEKMGVRGDMPDRSKEDPPPKRPPPAIGHRG